VLERWPNKMLLSCPACGLSYFRESGYFIGGMIITYALTLLVVIPVFLLSLLLPDVKNISDYWRFAAWIVFAIPLALFFMPYSYSLWLSLDYWIEPWKPEKTL
jgi:ABC-type multidrug transport system permease subunit